MTKKSTPEWSFMIRTEDIGDGVKTYRLSADEDAYAGLARRFDVMSLKDVRAHVTVQRRRGGSVFYIAGSVSAIVTQACVVTLDPVETAIEEPFESYFAEGHQVISFPSAVKSRGADASDQPHHHEIEILGDEESPEPVIDGQIDLGELCAQYLALAIPAYPRAPHADDLLVQLNITQQDVAPETGPDDQPPKKSPFAALKEWKDRLGE
jgi:uncharacterized metal-binding protein YceD (DUF177 family)